MNLNRNIKCLKNFNKKNSTKNNSHFDSIYFRSCNDAKSMFYLCNTYDLDCTIMQNSQIKYVNIALQFK